LAKEGKEGDLNLDQGLLNEYSKLKETAMARASKPTRDCATQEAQLKASGYCNLLHGMLRPMRVRLTGGVSLHACHHELQRRGASQDVYSMQTSCTVAIITTIGFLCNRQTRRRCAP
jgi:hypothetical protein